MTDQNRVRKYRDLILAWMLKVKNHYGPEWELNMTLEEICRCLEVPYKGPHIPEMVLALRQMIDMRLVRSYRQHSMRYYSPWNHDSIHFVITEQGEKFARVHLIGKLAVTEQSGGALSLT